MGVGIGSISGSSQRPITKAPSVNSRWEISERGEFSHRVARKPASSLLLGREIAITKVRGIWHEYRGIPVMPTFHPAFVLRQYTEENRRLVWEDLKAALERSR
jgi:hypothetical protein